MECPNLGIIIVDCSKIYSSSSHTQFVIETTQNYHFRIKIVTKMAMNSQ